VNELYFEEIEIGHTSVTKSRTITEADLVNFAALTWDTYPLHTDVEYAKTTVFGERIAHGMLVLSYAMGLLMSSGTSGKVVAFYGMDKLRFTGPTKIGDTIRVETEVIEKDDRSSKGGVVTTRFQVKNQRNETVIDALTKGLIAKKE
jgi:3-hydroxybutyryl-CoA dehydratase